jgi:hypothetical protein
MTSIGLPYAPARALPVTYEQDDGTALVVVAYFVACPVCGESFQGADPRTAGKDTDVTGRERLRPETPEDQITKSANRKYARHYQATHVEGDPALLVTGGAPEGTVVTRRHTPACEAGRDSRGCRACNEEADAAQALTDHLDSYPDPEETR